jgi:hypothetical protein
MLRTASAMHLGYLRLRLIATWRSTELDRQLAAGVDPQTSNLLALRARKLTGRRSRKRVADGLVRVYRRAQNTTPGFTAAVRPNVGELLAAQTVLAAIDRRLRSSAPVKFEGVAMLHALLTDAASPLYQSSEPGALASRLRAAAAALERTDPRG